MERPQSIIWFERLYLGQIGLGLLNIFLSRDAIAAQVAATPNSQLLPSWFMGATVALGTTIGLVLWYFIARRGSGVAKWILAALFVIGMLGLASTLAQGNTPPTLNIVGGIVMLLQAAAVVMLFRPDAKSWFER